MTNYELIYSHPELMIDWFPILGNHEYRGNTQAVLDYTNVSRRWSMPGRYYTKVFEKKGTAIRFVMIDTAPLIDKYRNESETYPDACKQDMDQQLAWIDSVLTVAKEDWVVVIGHHPIYAETSKETVNAAICRNVWILSSVNIRWISMHADTFITSSIFVCRAVISTMW